MVISYKENKFKNIYKNVENIEAVAVVKDQIEETTYGSKFKIEILHCDKYNKLKGTRLIVSSNKKEKLEYGDIITIKGAYQKITGYKNHGVFNYGESLKKENIYGKLKAKTIDKTGQQKDAYKLFVDINNGIKEKIDKYFSKENGNVLKALIIGDKSDLDDEVKENFQSNGLSHILAISGMHISCIILIFNKIIAKLSYDRRKNSILLIIILILYGFVIGFIASAVRAIIMSILAISAQIFYRKDNKLTSIMIACLSILIYNPYYIIDSGFLLSFGATIGIIYIFPKINKFTINNKILKYICEAVLITVAVNLTIFPITIYFFKRIPISFILTGILMSPLVFIIELLGIAFIFIPNFILPILIPIIEFIITIFLQISKIDLGGFYLKVPNILEITLYYLVLIYVTNIKSKKKYMIIIKRIIWILVVIIIIVTIANKNRNYITINFIDVNQGDSLLIQTEENKNILIDGGGSEEYDVGKNVLIPYLLSKKIQTIDYLMVSHFDTDHVAGCISVAKYLNVKNIIISKQIEENNNVKELLEIVQNKNINLIIVKSNDEIQIDKEVKILILSPDPKNLTKDMNNNSIVAKIIYKDVSILVTGDIEEMTEQRLVAKYKNTDYLNADILKVAHHRFKNFKYKKFYRSCFTQNCINRGSEKIMFSDIQMMRL